MALNRARIALIALGALVSLAYLFVTTQSTWDKDEKTFDRNERYPGGRRTTSVLRKKQKPHIWPEWTFGYSLQPWIVQNASTKERADGLKRRLPQVIGIGTKKCGTGALQYFLQGNPKFKMVNSTASGEAHFFDSNQYEKGLNYYRSLMPLSLPDDVTFEKTPRYFYSSRVPSRIMEWNKDVKIILVLCDPVPRVFSDYVFINTMGSPWKIKTMPDVSSFDEYVETALEDLEDIEQGAYESLGFGTYHSFIRNAWSEKTFQLTPITNGMYAAHLKDWYTYFPKRQIHIVDGEQLITNPGPVIEEIQKFMGLEVVVTSDDFEYHSEKGFYCLKNSPCLSSEKGATRGVDGPKMSSQTKNLLYKFYKPCNEELFRLLGKRFSWL